MPRRLGQHFLTRPSILEQLAVAACGESTPRVIEIGPGRGALTRHLLRRTEELHAIEIDEQLAIFLAREFDGKPNFHLHRADVLSTDLAQWGSATVVGNLPYYITAPIIDRFLQLDARYETAVFLVQREVADRLLSSPGSKDYGYLTVKTQLVCDVELVCHVPASAFSPAPKVESSAVRLSRRAQAGQMLPELIQLVSRSFQHKRKTLRNNLRAYYGEKVDGLPESNFRAEQLSIDQFTSILRRLTD